MMLNDSWISDYMSIISPNYLRKFRTIAQNINEERIQIAIDEAEALDIMPLLGADIMQRYRSIGAIIVDNMGSVLQDEQGNDIWAGTENALEPYEYKLLNGGYYKDECGEKHWFAGVKTALAYFAYARFIKAHAAQVTPYGIVVKEGEDSRSASQQTIAELASDARKVAENYMMQAMDYYRTIKGNKPQGAGRRQGRIITIGD